MRANHLPVAADLPLSEGKDREAALRKALRAASLLMGRPLDPQPVEETLLLQRVPTVLKKQAINKPTLESADGQVTEVDYDKWENTIYPEVPAGEYTVRYLQGYEPEKIPAIVKELIILLGTWFLLKDETARADALALVAIARKLK